MKCNVIHVFQFTNFQFFIFHLITKVICENFLGEIKMCDHWSERWTPKYSIFTRNSLLQYYQLISAAFEQFSLIYLTTFFFHSHITTILEQTLKTSRIRGWAYEWIRLCDKKGKHALTLEGKKWRNKLNRRLEEWDFLKFMRISW